MSELSILLGQSLRELTRLLFGALDRLRAEVLAEQRVTIDPALSVRAALIALLLIVFIETYIANSPASASSREEVG